MSLSILSKIVPIKDYYISNLKDLNLLSKYFLILENVKWEEMVLLVVIKQEIDDIYEFTRKYVKNFKQKR